MSPWSREINSPDEYENISLHDPENNSSDEYENISPHDPENNSSDEYENISPHDLEKIIVPMNMRILVSMI